MGKITKYEYIGAGIINTVISLMLNFMHPNVYGMSNITYFCYTFAIFCVFSWFIFLIADTADISNNDNQR